MCDTDGVKSSTSDKLKVAQKIEKAIIVRSTLYRTLVLLHKWILAHQGLNSTVAMLFHSFAVIDGAIVQERGY